MSSTSSSQASSGANTAKEQQHAPPELGVTSNKKSVTKSHGKEEYAEISAADQTIEAEEGLAISMDAEDPRLNQSEAKSEEEKDEGGKKEDGKEDEEVESDASEDSEDVDAELDKLEQSVCGDEDDDTDEDGGQAEPDFAPYDRSIKKKTGDRAGTTGGLGANSKLKGGRQLLSEDQEYDGIGTFDTQQEVTIDQDHTMEMDMEDTLDGDGDTTARKSLTQNRDLESGSAIEMTQTKKKPGAQTKYQKSREPDVVQQCAKAYTENPTPRRLGRMFAFWYSKKGEPRIVVGPDFGFSLLELALVNGICGLIINAAFNSSLTLTWSLGLSIVLIHNASFLTTVMKNPGVPPRNPNQHSQGYLNKVKTIDQSKFCKECKVIARRDVDTEHCSFCDYCIEELDHHCPWSSKCIGKSNMGAFKLFLAALVGCLVFAFMGGAMVLGESLHNQMQKAQVQQRKSPLSPHHL